MPELRIKRHLIRQAQIEKASRVLDLGCGTATLTLLVKKTHLDAHVIGIDGDARILAIARRKANQEGLDVTFDKGMASIFRMVTLLMTGSFQAWSFIT